MVVYDRTIVIMATETAQKRVVAKTTPPAPARKVAGIAKKVEGNIPSGGFAVIETGGKQYLVASGDVVRIEKLQGTHKTGDGLTFDKVLLWSDGKDITIGTPYISGKKIEGVLLESGKGKKTLVIKFKRKVRYHKKYGHRQPYMQIKIR